MILTRRQFVQHSTVACAALAAMKSNALAFAAEETGLKAVFKDDFYIGTAISGPNMLTSLPDYLKLLAREFNAITMENNMKWGVVHPQEDTWNWEVFCLTHCSKRIIIVFLTLKIMLARK